MELHELPYGKIIVLQNDIAEVIIDDEVVMDEAMIDHYHGFLLSHLKAPFSLLINKVNSYTYDFNAQLKLATLVEINVMAVIAYNRITKNTTELLASYPRSKEWNLKVFSNRDEAMNWLISEQKKFSS